MKFVTDRPFGDPEAAARKLIEIANTVESVQDGRIHIELINLPFLQASGNAEEYQAGIKRAIDNGWLGRLCEVHPSRRGYVRLVSRRRAGLLGNGLFRPLVA
jgi:hypothetical protein